MGPSTAYNTHTGLKKGKGGLKENMLNMVKLLKDVIFTFSRSVFVYEGSVNNLCEQHHHVLGDVDRCRRSISREGN